MSERTSPLLAQLREHDAPPVDTTALVLAATTAGRRRVRRRRGLAALATAVLVGGVGCWALAAPDTLRATDDLVATVDDRRQEDVGVARERVPLGGTNHHRTVERLTDRRVVPLTPDLSVSRDEPSSASFMLDKWLTMVQYEWGTGDAFSPRQAEEFNAQLGQGQPRVAATPFPTSPLEHCRDEHRTDDPWPGTCLAEPDGTALAVVDFLEPESNQQIRVVRAYHPDGWIVHLDVRSGGRGEEPDTANMPSTDELLTFMREGQWFV